MDNSSGQILDLLDAKEASEKKIDKLEKKLSNDHTKAYLLGLLGIPLGFLASILIYASAIGILWLISLYESNNYVWGSIDNSPMPGIGAIGILLMILLFIPLFFILFIISSAILYFLITLIACKIIDSRANGKHADKYEPQMIQELVNLENINQQIEEMQQIKPQE